jgi:hypothetical protein
MACRPAGKFGELNRTYSPTIDIGADTQNIGATWVDIDDTDDASSDRNLNVVCAQAPLTAKILERDQRRQMGESAGGKWGAQTRHSAFSAPI